MSYRDSLTACCGEHIVCVHVLWQQPDKGCSSFIEPKHGITHSPPHLLSSLLIPVFVLQTIINASFRFAFSAGLLAHFSFCCTCFVWIKYLLNYSWHKRRLTKLKSKYLNIKSGKTFCFVLDVKCCRSKTHITSSFLSHDTSCLLCRFSSR